MRKNIPILLLLVLCFSLAGCGKTYQGHDGLIEKAREEIPVSEADRIEITIAGSTDVDGNCLVWFITGNEYQLHGYYPIEFKQLKRNDGDYKFVMLYQAYDAGTDIAVYPWNGFVVLVNNENCTEFKLTYSDGETETVSVDTPLPFLWSTDKKPSQYIFLDAAGNELN